DEPVAVRRLQPKVPRDLETICLKCLQKDPKKRYTSAVELADDLRRFGAGEPVLARPVGPAGRAARWSRRRPAVAGLVGTVALAVVAGAAAAMLFAWQADAGRRAAEGHAREQTRLRHEAEKLTDDVKVALKRTQEAEARSTEAARTLRQERDQKTELL